MIRNKRGWIKIVEAFIAIILIASIMLTVYSKQPTRTKNEEIIKVEDSILNEISQSEALRQDVLDSNNLSISLFIQSKMPPNLNFTAKICAVDDVCGLDVYRKEVYARERIISSTLTEYSPKKLRLFAWER
ncbi:MAG: hypothetical protein KKE50_01920 [Nanoarchaeota archaeon]|nr:hypothetical protein [Nanoarchaeota archaeon]